MQLVTRPFNTQAENKSLNPNLTNLIDSSHTLIFTLRRETEPSPFQKRQIEKGVYFEAVDPVEQRFNKLDVGAAVEVGFFANTLAALCLEKGIDVSFTLCFSRELDNWRELPFITQRPLFVMTIGKGKRYRIDQAVAEGWAEDDFKPSFDRIVRFVESD